MEELIFSDWDMKESLIGDKPCNRRDLCLVRPFCGAGSMDVSIHVSCGACMDVCINASWDAICVNVYTRVSWLDISTVTSRLEVSTNAFWLDVCTNVSSTVEESSGGDGGGSLSIGGALGGVGGGAVGGSSAGGTVFRRGTVGLTISFKFFNFLEPAIIFFLGNNFENLESAARKW